MKTLLVLTALAAAAVAAPTINDHVFTSRNGAAFQANSLGNFKREKKSPTDFTDLAQTTEDLKQPLELDSSPEMSARTLLLKKKKPIIIKNKLGHHQLYRDSDEELDDSQEKCTKEVTVKLCHAGRVDPKPGNKGLKDLTTNEHKSDNEMEQSIKMAKEAVENLQRDLNNLNETSGGKIAQWKHTNSVADAEIHADIEAARQALEHIHKSFANIESMNLRSTTVNNVEDFEDNNKHPANTDDERMARWKEAMTTIQKNIEVAKNIEDSFMTENSVLLPTADSLIKTELADFNENSMKSSETSPSEALKDSALLPAADSFVKTEFTGCNKKSMKSSETDPSRTSNVESEMTVSASEPKESHLEITPEEKSSSDLINMETTKPNEDQTKSLDLPLMEENSPMEKMTIDEETNASRNSESSVSIHSAPSEALKDSALLSAADSFVKTELSNFDENSMKSAETAPSEALTEADLQLTPDSLIKTEEAEFNENSMKSSETAPSEALKDSDLQPTALIKTEEAEFNENSMKSSETAPFEGTNNSAPLPREASFDNNELADFNEMQMKSVETAPSEALNVASEMTVPSSELKELTPEGKSSTDLEISKLSQDQTKPVDLSLLEENSPLEKMTIDEDANTARDSQNTNVDQQLTVDDVKPDAVHEKEANETDEKPLLEEERAVKETQDVNKIEDMQSIDDEKTTAGKSAENIGMESNFDVIDTTNLMKAVEEKDLNQPQDFSNIVSKTIDDQENLEVASNGQEMKLDNEINKEFNEMPKSVHEPTVDVHEDKASDMLESATDNSETVMTGKAADPEGLKIENVVPSAFNLVSKTLKGTLVPINKVLDSAVEATEGMHMKAASDTSDKVNIDMSPENKILKTNLNAVTQVKSAGVESGFRPNAHMHTKDFAGKSHLERSNPQHWRDHMARGAYGIYGPAAGAISGRGSAGAVGIFPNAHVGGCAIPLLLSCSPSVVSGSLAKAHPTAYAASPAYRMGENFKFHNKRDITKILVTKGKRSPTKVIQKMSLDKKL